MSFIDILAALASAGCIVAYVCRFDLLVAWRHQPAISVMHLALGTIALDALLKAMHAETDLVSVMCLVAAGAWIAVSRSSWASGVPAHFWLQRLKVVHSSGEPDRAVVRIKP